MPSTPQPFVPSRDGRTAGRIRQLALLARSESGAHLVQFYDNDSFLCDTLGEYAAIALVSGDPLVIIATRSHRESLVQRLQTNSFDVTRARSNGQLTLLDAEETLSLFMRGDAPDADLFRQHVGGLLRRARTLRENRPARAYGEMVDLLWKAGNRQGALRLEELWNDLAKVESFSLVCGYSMDNFCRADDGAGFQAVCDAHSHVVPTETFFDVDSEDTALRTVSLLQQRARALEIEVEHRRELEKSLREREAELRDFLDNATEGIHWVGPDGTILYANSAELALLGYTHDEYVGRNIHEFHAHADVIRDILTRLCAGESIANYEASLRCKDGSLKHVLINSNVLFRDGKFIHTRCFTRDITARKQAEERLRVAEQRFRLMHETTPDGVAVTAPLRDETGKIRDFRYTYVNPVVARDMGRPAEDLVGRTLLEVLPGLDKTPFWQAFCRVADTGEHETYEQPYDENGWKGWYHNIVVSLGDEVATTYSDITKRKRAEDSLRFLAEAGNILASSLDYDTTLRSIARLTVPTIADWVAVDLQGQDGRLSRLAVAHVDPSKVALAHEIHERFPIDMHASSGIGSVLRTGEAELVPDITDALLESAIADPELLSIIRSLGLRSSICVPLKARDRVVGAMSLVSAESGRRFSDSDLRVADELAQRASAAIENALYFRAAEEANQAKDDFLAVVSHELRTPLNAILGWVHMLRQEVLPQAQGARALETIERNARAQNQLIDDLLDVSRIVSGKLRLVAESVDLPQVIERAIDTLGPTAAAKGVRINRTLDPSASPVMGDPERLQQVVANLLSNAVKFSAKDTEVHVVLRKLESAVEITVQDHGQGIDPNFLPHVFERFRQADSRTTRSRGGLGLGLAIVRNLVELHGGSVRVESEGHGHGATFTVCLPVSTLRTPSFTRPPALHLTPALPAVHSPAELRGVRVLVVDDEEDARDVVAALLARCDMNVATASSVEEALRMVPDIRPSIIVSDIGMPGEDGYTLIKRLRALPADQGGKTPAVALTAYARTEERTRALVSGFNMHVPKPVEPAELLAALVSLTTVFERA